MSSNLAKSGTEQADDATSAALTLRDKIAASQRRIAERDLATAAKQAAEAAKDYTKANPAQVVAGAVAAGVVLGLLTSPGRALAVKAASSTASVAGAAAKNAATGAADTVKTAATKRASAFTSLIADAVIAYGLRLIDEAVSGQPAGADDKNAPSPREMTQRARGKVVELAERLRG